MKHIKQRKDECFPTVLAMLTDSTVDEILVTANALGRVHSWAEFMSNPALDPELAQEVTLTYRGLARKYAPYLIDYASPLNLKAIWEDKEFLTFKEFRRLISERSRGAVISASRYKGYALAHIAAFERGLIYDGCLDSPVAPREYYVHLSAKTVLCPHKIVGELD